MKKLILCVDRDDDIGEKANIETPIISRQANLDAAVALGLKDPEDSDTNSILSAVSMYDQLKSEGDDVEVATICGSPSVGYRSDQQLNKELDVVLEKVNPDTSILVTDGAEDEYITPIVSSKIDISHIRTVYVKQSESVENLYYMIVKTFKEEKAKRKLLLPISLALLVYGFFGVADLLYDLMIHGVEALPSLTGFGIGVITFIIGLYLLIRIYDIDEKSIEIYKKIRNAVSTGSVWLPFTVVAGLIVIASSLEGWDVIVTQEISSPPKVVLTFAHTVIWWWLGAIFLHELGRVIDTYLTQGKVKRSFWAVWLTLIALTFILWAAFDYIRVLIGMQKASNVLPMVAVNIILGLLIGILGGLANRSFRDQQNQDESTEKED
ncbi:MAG: DUF373 family protein [Thermoplasmatota archaeon]